jgi:hypothetical protein
MKLQVSISILFLALLIQSCIRSEAPNTEAAINKCEGKEITTATINNNSKEVDVYITGSATLAQLQLTFGLPEGATIVIADEITGDGQDSEGLNTYNFTSMSRLFRVTSEDLKHSAVYTVKAISSGLPTSYSFETLKQIKPYHIMRDFNARSGDILDWSSGNPGFEFTGMGKTPESYPTMQSADGYRGTKCAKLVTRSTGGFGALLGMNIAAGNLFIGNFDLTQEGAISKDGAPRATRFGLPFYYHPTALEGVYRYKAGDVFTDGKTEVPDKKDRFDIYAILYLPNDPTDMLNGFWTEDDPRIVSIARISEADAVESSSWKAFSIPFVSRKPINDTLLKSGQYKLTLVFSSSVEGAFFKGAVGSTLDIDEVSLVTQEQDVDDQQL